MGERPLYADPVRDAAEGDPGEEGEPRLRAGDRVVVSAPQRSAFDGRAGAVARVVGHPGGWTVLVVLDGAHASKWVPGSPLGYSPALPFAEGELRRVDR